MLTTGLALFGIGSLAAGLADTTGQLIAARAGMGVGGALLLTTTCGPLIGGFVLDHFWWGAIFLINLPVVSLGLVAVVTLVPESKNRQGDRPDLPDAVRCPVSC
ncbi:integral membrane efflux protein [Streptomyces coelicoflavus ZG0656]|nr:integral membrane efflux protein [Streptomyces coelicoflavus ZG0656]